MSHPLPADHQRADPRPPPGPHEAPARRPHRRARRRPRPPQRRRGLPLPAGLGLPVPHRRARAGLRPRPRPAAAARRRSSCPGSPRRTPCGWGTCPTSREARAAFGIRDVAYLDDPAEGPRAPAPRATGGLRRRALAGRACARAARRARARHGRRSSEAFAELRIVKDEGEIALLREGERGHRRRPPRGHARGAPGDCGSTRCRRSMERAFRWRAAPRPATTRSWPRAATGRCCTTTTTTIACGAGDLLLDRRRRGVPGLHRRRHPRLSRLGPLHPPAARRVRGGAARPRTRASTSPAPGSRAWTCSTAPRRCWPRGCKDLGLAQGLHGRARGDRGRARLLPPRHRPHPGPRRARRAGRQEAPAARRKSGRLRFRARLEPGFVITIEPGLYFMPVLLHDRRCGASTAAACDFDRAEKFLEVGGVRIEDDVVVQQERRPETSPRVPKTVAEVEAACARG